MDIENNSHLDDMIKSSYGYRQIIRHLEFGESTLDLKQLRNQVIAKRIKEHFLDKSIPILNGAII